MSGPSNTVLDTTNENRFRSGTEYIIDASILSQMLGQKNLVIIDVRSAVQCPDGHIPGAYRIDYSRLVKKQNFADGMLPGKSDIDELFSECGIKKDSFVVAYDDNYGVDAARLLWTLDVVGHNDYALLSGGFAAWDELDFPISNTTIKRAYLTKNIIDFSGLNGYSHATIEHVTHSLNNRSVKILDTRSPGEFAGSDKRALRGGHIPGAINYEWSRAIDECSNGIFHSFGKLKNDFRELGVSKENEVIVYCQSNRRSSHTFLVLKWLGYQNVRAYAGSWSEWGNSSATPIECDGD